MTGPTEPKSPVIPAVLWSSELAERLLSATYPLSPSRALMPAHSAKRLPPALTNWPMTLATFAACAGDSCWGGPPSQTTGPEAEEA